MFDMDNLKCLGTENGTASYEYKDFSISEYVENDIKEGVVYDVVLIAGNWGKGHALCNDEVTGILIRLGFDECIEVDLDPLLSYGKPDCVFVFKQQIG